MNNPEESGRFLKIIDNHVIRLEAIIEDLMELSKIERKASVKEIALDNHSLCQILQTAIDQCKEKAKIKNIKIEMSCEEDLNALVNPVLWNRRCSICWTTQ